MTCTICSDDDRPAEIGQACRRCHARVAAALRPLGIPALVQDLASLGYVQRDQRADRVYEHTGKPGPHFDQVAHALPVGPINGRRGGARVTGSATPPVPVSLDKVDLTAPARPASWAPYARGLLGVDQDQIGTLSVATILERAVRDWRAQRGQRESMPAAKVPELCAWLYDRLDWACAECEQLADFAEEIRELYTTLTAATGGYEAPPRQMEARCPDCGQRSLTQAWDDANITCDCGRSLTPGEYADYLRKLIQQETASMKKQDARAAAEAAIREFDWGSYGLNDVEMFLADRPDDQEWVPVLADAVVNAVLGATA